MLADLLDGLIPRWHADAACLDTHPDLFFPLRGQPTAPAVAICSTCPVRADCLAFAIDEGINHGIWGGLSARQRRALRRNPETTNNDA